MIPLTYPTDLRQGHIIRPIHFDKNDADAYFVLTADCDFANNKFSDCITIVPMFGVEKFLEGYIIPEYAKSELQKRVKFHSSKIGVDEKFIEEHLLKSDKVGLPDRYNEFKKDRIIDICERYLYYGGGTDSFIDEFCKKKAIKPSSFIKQRLGNLRSEFLMLGPLSFLSSSLGYVVSFRMPKSIGSHEVYCLEGEQSEYMYEVIGKLDDALRFLISQAFSVLYMRIGMDRSIEKDIGDVISIIGDHYDKEK